MKQQATQYLALDVHQATSVATVREASGAIRMRATVPIEAKAIVGLVRGIGPPVHVAFEEGTHAQWLYRTIDEMTIIRRLIDAKIGRSVHASNGAHSQPVGMASGAALS